MVRSHNDIGISQHMQRIAVEEYLATIIDEVRGTRYLTVAHQVALSVVTSAIGILPTL